MVCKQASDLEKINLLRSLRHATFVCVCMCVCGESFGNINKQNLSLLIYDM